MRTIRRFLSDSTKQGTKQKPPKLEVTMQDMQEAIKKMNERKKILENDAGDAMQ